MNTIIINITNNDTFSEILERMIELESKYTTVVMNDHNNATVNITGTLEELENE